MTTATMTEPTPRRRRRRRLEPLDPVTSYACRVLQAAPELDSWRAELPAVAELLERVAADAAPVLAGRPVRLAAIRHLRDLVRQQTPAFPYYFDTAAAEHIIGFFPLFLTLESGEPFVLPDWLQFSYGQIFGWKSGEGDRHGLRRFRHGFFETSKGSGKSPSAAGVGIYGVAFDDEPFAEVYSTGFDKGQASIIVNDAIRMANGSSDLLEDLIVDKYNIAHPASGSFFRAMSSQHRSKSGPRPFYVLSDEIHEHRDGTVISKAEAGFKSRRQPLGLKFTNSGSDPNSFCGQLHQKSLDVLSGTVVDEEWFAYVCSLDPCTKHAGEGYLQPLEGCEDCDDWTDPAVWPKIAPALGVVIQPKYLQDAVTEALTVPDQFNLKRRLNFCLWTQTRNVWIPSDRWDACKVDAVATANPQRRPCAAALDLSSKNDLSGYVVAIRYDDPPSDRPSEVAEIEGLTPQGERGVIKITLNFTIDLVPVAWIPRETMLARIQNERIPYDLWEREGHIIVTPGPVMDHQAIYEHVVASEKAFGIQRIGYDDKDATMLAVKLRDEARLGDKVVAIGQGKKLSEAIKLVAKVLVPAKRIRHNGHPVLKMCVGNVEPHTDRLGAMWIEKAGELKRIDLAVCSVMAIQQVMLLPAFQHEPQVFFAGGRR